MFLDTHHSGQNLKLDIFKCNFYTKNQKSTQTQTQTSPLIYLVNGFFDLENPEKSCQHSYGLIFKALFEFRGREGGKY